MPEDRDKLAGKTKETAGKVTGDDRMEVEGRAQHDTAEGKEKAKGAADRAKGMVQGIKESFSKDKR